MSLSKKDLRLEMLSRRQAMSPELVRENGLIIQEHIMGLKLWQEAKRVLLYMPVKNEVATAQLLGDALAGQKALLLPRCRRDRAGSMDLAEISSLGQLSRGLFDIPEPDAALCPSLPPSGWNLDLAVIPGVAFDRQGFRLGYGGGYYDRFLAELAGRYKTVTIGLAYSFQVLDALPADQWDTPVNMLCLEKGVIEL